MAGLAYHLGVDRKTILNYEKESEFFQTVKKARQRLEDSVERRLFAANATGAIFWLKNNAGYTDRQEHDVTVRNLETILTESMP